MNTIRTFIYRILAFAGCLVALMLGGCVKNEFKVEFEFPKDHVGNYLMTYYAWDSRGGRWIEHTASIQEGKASADCITRLPTLVYVSDASRPGASMAFYAERGDEIKISGDGKDMASWTVTGNKLSERWSVWHNAAYAHKQDTRAMHRSIAEYVEKNPKDELSALLLLTEWNRREDPEGFVKLWNSIDKGSRERRLIEASGVTDLLGVEFTTAADGKLEYAKDPGMKNLALRTRDRGLDTVRLTKPSLLYFYNENNAARREAADTLKTLLKAYPDVTKSVMADIYMDSDSMAWNNAIRRDSLDGVIRAWQPRGIAEASMVSLGVTRVPWFIVKDKDGKEKYAGTELKEASAAFRKLMGKPAAGSSSAAVAQTSVAQRSTTASAKSQPEPRKPDGRKPADRKPLPMPGQAQKPQKNLK